MKLYKDNILEILKEYNLDKQEYIVLSSASLVLQNVKEYTTDIDIAVSEELYSIILEKHNCAFEKKIDNYDIWFIDNIINFSNHYYEETEYIELLGYKVQTLRSILELKLNLNRAKDVKDIELIKDFYKTKKLTKQ